MATPALVGITDFAQGQLGDVVFVELPELGVQRKKGEQAAVVESVKAASEVYAPVAGEIVAVNDELADNPALVNEDAARQGLVLQDQDRRPVANCRGCSIRPPTTL